MAFPFVGGQESIGGQESCSFNRSYVALTAWAYRESDRDVHCGAFRGESQGNPSPCVRGCRDCPGVPVLARIPWQRIECVLRTGAACVGALVLSTRPDVRIGGQYVVGL